MLLAQVSPEVAGFPWSELIISVGGNLVAAAIGAAVAVWAVSRTEWFRKISNWEPFANNLWTARLSCFLKYIEWMIAIEDQADRVKAMAMRFTQDPAHFEAIRSEWLLECDEFERRMNSLGVVWRSNVLITPSHISTLVVDFVAGGIEFTKAAMARMEARAGMPVEWPDPSRVIPLSELTPDQAKERLRAVRSTVESAMAKCLRLTHLDVATAISFESMGEGMPIVKLKELHQQLREGTWRT
jgi:hypothetical protein